MKCYKLYFMQAQLFKKADKINLMNIANYQLKYLPQKYSRARHYTDKLLTSARKTNVLTLFSSYSEQSSYSTTNLAKTANRSTTRSAGDLGYPKRHQTTVDRNVNSHSLALYGDHGGY